MKGVALMRSAWQRFALLALGFISALSMVPSCQEHGMMPWKRVSGHPGRILESSNQPVQLRPYPYPYHAMLAIASDADHQTLRKFNQIHQFLNTYDMTPYGRGLGLDIADSFFIYNGSNIQRNIDVGGVPLHQQLAYFYGLSLKPYAASAIRHYLSCGWIDSLHSYGDFSTVTEKGTRFHRLLAVKAVQRMLSDGVQVPVWIDHGNMANVDNFGSRHLRPFFHYQMGAVPQSPYYHLDVTRKLGIRYMWTDIDSTSFGLKKVMKPVHMPDGSILYGFSRYTHEKIGSRGEVLWQWTAGDLDDELSLVHLRKLVREGKSVVVAQHLAANQEFLCLPKNAVQALQTLAHWQDDGKILVARTSRLLTYERVHSQLHYHLLQRGRWLEIHIDPLYDPVFGKHWPSLSELRGITFYTPHPMHTIIFVGSTRIPDGQLVVSPSDGHAPSIGIRWFTPHVQNEAVVLPKVL